MQEIKFKQRQSAGTYFLLILGLVMVLLFLISLYLFIIGQISVVAPVLTAIIALLVVNSSTYHFATGYAVGERMINIQTGALISMRYGIPYEDIVDVDLVRHKKIAWPAPSQQIFDKETRMKVFVLASGHSPDNIVIDTNEKVTDVVGDSRVRYLISPENSEEFIKQVKMRMQK